VRSSSESASAPTSGNTTWTAPPISATWRAASRRPARAQW